MTVLFNRRYGTTAAMRRKALRSNEMLIEDHFQYAHYRDILAQILWYGFLILFKEHLHTGFVSVLEIYFLI